MQAIENHVQVIITGCVMQSPKRVKNISAAYIATVYNAADEVSFDS